MKRSRPTTLSSEKERIDFATSNYKNYINEHFSTVQKDKIGSIQSHGLCELDSFDSNFIKEIEGCISNCPKTPYDIFAWRAGKMKPKHRPFLSASFSKKQAKFYLSKHTHLHKIRIKKGSQILPLYALGKEYGSDEIIISKNKLKNRIFYYIHK